MPNSTGHMGVDVAVLFLCVVILQKVRVLHDRLIACEWVQTCTDRITG